MKRNPNISEERLLGFARRHLSEAFPNPERIGCPAEGELRLLAAQPQQADAAVGEHLSHCSPCFNRFMDLLADLRQEQKVQKQPLWKEVFAWPKTSPLWIGSAVMVVGLLSVAAYFVAIQRESSKTELPTSPQIGAKPGPVVFSPFPLDLRGLSKTRAPISEQERRVVDVPQKPLEISIVLPVGSEEGLYRVSLMVGDRTLWTIQSEARLVQQKTTLQVRVNLAEFPPGSYAFEVESARGFHLRQPIALQNPELEQGGKRE